MAHGGKRAGAGRPKGKPNPETVSKAEAREILRAIVMKHMAEMTDAQIKNAKGLKYLVGRAKSSGKFEKLTADDAERMLNGEESDRFIVEIWDKDPSVQAYTDLMNRTLDKPAEQEQGVKVTGTLKVIWDGD